MLTNIITAVCTAYCSCKLCCGTHHTGITASGHTPLQGITIAAPRSIPFGTHVVIGTHTYTVQDRTSKKWDGRWDVYFNSHSDAKNFGIRTNTITIITKAKL